MSLCFGGGKEAPDSVAEGGGGRKRGRSLGSEGKRKGERQTEYDDSYGCIRRERGKEKTGRRKVLSCIGRGSRVVRKGMGRGARLVKEKKKKKADALGAS